MRQRFVIAFIFLCATSLTACAQTFEVTGVPGPRTFRRDELRAMPNRVTRTIDGKTYAGVLIADLLRTCGIDLDKLKGKELARSFTIAGSDGYTTTFAIAEAIGKFHDVEAMLADTVDGKDLSSDEGPLRVFTLDKAAKARWVSKAIKITVQ